MAVDPISDEEGRLGALRRYGPPKFGNVECLTEVVKIAQAALGAPMAAVSLVDRECEIFLCARGLPDASVARDRSFCALAIKNGGPLAITDTLADTRVSDFDIVRQPAAIRSYLGVPLLSADGYALGAVSIMDTAPRQFIDADIAVLVDLSRIVMTLMEARQPHDADYLTGALTRRQFQMEIEREFDRATRYERPASLVFFDIDGFRDVNSVMGAVIADEVIKSVASRAMDRLRSSDVIGRIGGEAFGMLLPETLGYEASQCAERLREEISRLRFKSQKGILSVTASFGISPLDAAIASPALWFAQADVALYAAKQAGRDGVSFAPPLDRDAGPLREEPAVPLLGPMH